MHASGRSQRQAAVGLSGSDSFPTRHLPPADAEWCRVLPNIRQDRSVTTPTPGRGMYATTWRLLGLIFITHLNEPIYEIGRSGFDAHAMVGPRARGVFWRLG